MGRMSHGVFPQRMVAMEVLIQTRNVEKTLSFAAEELRRYLARMVREENVFSVSLQVKNPAEFADCFTVEMDCYGGTITGSNPRSVLLGV